MSRSDTGLDLVTGAFSHSGSHIAERLLADGRVSDAVFQRARALLGEEGVVDLTGLVGYYTLLALTLNAFEVPVPEDGKVPWSK